MSSFRILRSSHAHRHSAVMTWLAGAVFTIAVAAGAVGGEPTAADVPALAAYELIDQYGQANSLARMRGSVVVAVVVSVRRLALIERWERDLGARAPGIRFLNVADLPDDVPVDPARTAATLRKRVPAGVSVLMDTERLWARTFELDTAAPNLLVFDARGRLLARFRGRWTAALAEDVARALPVAEPAP